jgi:hypothetical protein
MYRPHADETVQLATGMMGLFAIHPRDGAHPVDRDFDLSLDSSAVHSGTARPDSAVMTHCDLWTINSRVFPGIDPMVVRTGQRGRIRVATLSMHEPPMHVHGAHLRVGGTDGRRVPERAQFPATTVLVPVGGFADIELVVQLSGDVPVPCHEADHTMNTMAHDLLNPLDVRQRDLDERTGECLPGYVSMGESSMAEHHEHVQRGHHHAGPPNTLPMLMGTGPDADLEMGGMFTVIKVRDAGAGYADPGPYEAPPRSVARRVSSDPNRTP